MHFPTTVLGLDLHNLQTSSGGNCKFNLTYYEKYRKDNQTKTRTKTIPVRLETE